MNSRMFLPDIVRGICVLEIVFFWHIFDYISPTECKAMFTPLTCGALACFTFLSGFFLGKKKIDCRKFYISRLKRFMPLLLLAAFSFYILHMISFKTMLFTVTGLSCFVLPQPLTLWFFSMMIVLYALTPLLLYKLDILNSCDKKKLLLRSILVYCLLFILNIIFPTDYRFLVYYPFYIVGIIFPYDKFCSIYKYKFVIGLLVVVLLFVAYWLNNVYVVTEMIQGLGGMSLILILSSIIDKYKCNVTVLAFSFLSYISMTAYLFHRVVYGLFRRFLQLQYLEWWHVLFMMILLMLIAYYIQKLYDILLQRLNFNIF